jgi:hypothetical protein
VLRRAKLQPPYRIHHGLIVWLDDCTPLDDVPDRAKRRPIVVVEPSLPTFSSDDPVAMVICCSATYGADEPDGLLMPNLTTEPQTSTGLPEICWAIPRWFVPVRHSTINKCEHSGRLSGRKLQQILIASLARFTLATTPIPPPR